MKENSYLLDTHVFIWLMEKSGRISPKIMGIVADSENSVFVSVATVWEIVIKSAKKRLRVPKDILGDIKAAKFQVLPIEVQHALAVEKLPGFHKDPFDRILIAQAKAEKLTLITSDKKIWQYKINLIRV